MSNSSVFQNIYKKEIWGKGEGSGTGSNPKFCKKYITYLQNLINSGKYQRILEIGCGDGRIASEIDWSPVKLYIGVDAVDIYPQTSPQSNMIFMTSDASVSGSLTLLEETFGPFDLVLIKDVLMHWTDEEISRLMEEMRRLAFPAILMTNNYQYIRSPEKNGLPRDPRANRYSWAPISCDHPVFKEWNFKPVLYYPNKNIKQVAFYESV